MSPSTTTLARKKEIQKMQAIYPLFDLEARFFFCVRPRAREKLEDIDDQQLELFYHCF